MKIQKKLGIMIGSTLGVGAISATTAAVLYKNTKKKVENNELTLEDKEYKTKSNIIKAAGATAIATGSAAIIAGAALLGITLNEDEEESKESYIITDDIDDEALNEEINRSINNFIEEENEINEINETL